LNLDPGTNLETDGSRVPANGRLVAIDLGAKRVGVAVSDEMRMTTTPLPFIERRSWKDLLRRVTSIIGTYDARGLVIGLPLNLDGTEGEAAQEARRLAENFRKSLNVPVFLQDERLTTFATKLEMRANGVQAGDIEEKVDSESAALILRDFIGSHSVQTRSEATASGSDLE
jgi:putative Holliday junction resolvase